jgi:hypothetical protein
MGDDPPSSGSLRISDSAEEQVLDQIRQSERKRHNRYLDAERELSQCKARVDELER